MVELCVIKPEPPNAAHVHDRPRREGVYRVSSLVQGLGIDMDFFDTTSESEVSMTDSTDPLGGEEESEEVGLVKIMQHLTNCELSRAWHCEFYANGKNGWDLKYIAHSPFPMINRTFELQWINNREFYFFGWAKDSLFHDLKIVKFKIKRDYKGGDSIRYSCKLVSPRTKNTKSSYLSQFRSDKTPLTSKGSIRKIAIWMDVEDFNYPVAGPGHGLPVNEYCNSLYIFDESSLRLQLRNTVGVMPPSTVGHQTVNLHNRVTDEDHVFIFGGKTKKGQMSNDVWTLNLTDSISKWRCIPARSLASYMQHEVPPASLRGFSMTSWKDRYLVLVGSGMIWLFDTVEELWERLNADCVPVLFNFKVITVHNWQSLIIYSGRDSHGDGNDKIYLYNFITQKLWYMSIAESAPGIRFGQNLQITFDFQLRKLIIMGGEIDLTLQDTGLHDCNEIRYTTVYEMSLEDLGTRLKSV